MATSDEAFDSDAGSDAIIGTTSTVRYFFSKSTSIDSFALAGISHTRFMVNHKIEG